MLFGLGREPIRDLPQAFEGSLPDSLTHPKVFLPGTLVVQGVDYEADPELAKKTASWQGLGDWPVVILVDDSAAATHFYGRSLPVLSLQQISMALNNLWSGIMSVLNRRLFLIAV
jgi:hypothetical protein